MLRSPASRGRRFGRMRRPASLGAKLLLILTVVGLVAAIAITLLLAGLITPSFTSLENRAVASQVERTQMVLSRYAGSVERLAREGPAQGLARGDLVDGRAYLSEDGRVVESDWRDRAEMGGRFAAVASGFDPARVLAGRVSGRFYARIGNGIAAVGVARVRRAGVEGYAVLARIVTPPLLSSLLHRTASIDLRRNRDVSETSDIAIRRISVPMIDVDGRPVGYTTFDVRRDVSLLGRRIVLVATAGSTLLLLLMLIVLRVAIARLVLRPLQRIEGRMQTVSASGSLVLLDTDIVEEGRRDEIGSLGRSFYTMLRQLKDLRERIEGWSFELGRSESAASVMHNVRNALNPIGTILSQSIAHPSAIDRATLDRAIAELARSDVPQARREKLAALVGAAVSAEAENRDAIRAELIVAREAMADVLEIIGQQQGGTHERPPLQVCDVSEIVARHATIARHPPDVSIALTFPAGRHLVLANRVILSQVIGNLFVNAAEAIVARGTGSGSISVTIADRPSREVADGVVIAIRDDGEGFAHEIGIRIFDRGFSTRAHKSGGLGLHWSANAMTAMGGSLRLESGGSGLGAVAILKLRGAAADPLSA